MFPGNKLQALRSVLWNFTIYCGGKTIRANKVTLALHSEFFEAWFEFSLAGDTFHTKNSVTLEELDGSALEAIVDQFYGEKLILNQDNIANILKGADFLICNEILSLCSAFLEKSLSKSNSFGIFFLARQFSLNDLGRLAEKFIQQNFRLISASEEFLSLSVSELVYFLENDNLGTHPESDVLDAALRWLDSASDPAAHFIQVIRCVRLCLMSETEYDLSMARITEAAAKLDLVPEKCTFLRECTFYRNYMSGAGSTTHGNKVVTPYQATPRIPNQILFLLAGFSSGVPASSIQALDIRSERWTNLTLQLPVGIAYPSSQTFKDKIYLFGGVRQPIAHMPQTFSRDTYIVDLGTGLLKKTVPMKTKRNFVSSAILDNKIYAIGGKEAPELGVRLGSCEVLDLEEKPLNWVKISDMRSRRSDAGAVGFRRKVFVVGGFNGRNSLSTVEIYDPARKIWIQGANLNVRRTGLSCVVLDDCIYAIGGSDGIDRLNSVERYCPQTKRWELVAPMTVARSNLGVGCVEGRIVVAGGYKGDDVTCSAEIYNKDLNTWEMFTPLTIPKSGMAFSVVDCCNISDQQRFCYQNKENLVQEIRNKAMTPCLNSPCPCLNFGELDTSLSDISAGSLDSNQGAAEEEEEDQQPEQMVADMVQPMDEVDQQLGLGAEELVQGLLILPAQVQHQGEVVDEHDEHPHHFHQDDQGSEDSDEFWEEEEEEEEEFMDEEDF